MVHRSAIQKNVALSVKETELSAKVTEVQSMMFVYKVIMSKGLDDRLPMRPKSDNASSIDLANSWIIRGCNRDGNIRLSYI